MSVKLTGSLMLAVRLPAVVLGGLTAWGVFRLASLTIGARRPAMMAVLLLPAIPVLAIGGVLITSDTPLVCCWTWAAVWTYRAVRSQQTRAWIAAGLIGALGVWAKYSFLAFLASVGLFLLMSPAHRRQLGRIGFWAMTLLCVGLGLAPILIWNAAHGWAGAGQLADRVGLSSRATWVSIWPVLTFLGGEFVALGGIWWVAGMAALVGALTSMIRDARFRIPGNTEESGAGSRSGLIYLLCLWGAIWTACLAASLLGETEANWMVPGYISLVVLIGMRADDVFARGGARKWVYTAAWCLSVSADRRDSPHGVVLSRHRQVSPRVHRQVAGAPAAVRADRPIAGAPGSGSSRPGANGLAQRQGRVAVCPDANVRTGLDPVVLPTRTARDLLPELELRDDGQTRQSARPVASQPAPRPGCLSGSGRDRCGRQEYAS